MADDYIELFLKWTPGAVIDVVREWLEQRGVSYHAHEGRPFALRNQEPDRTYLLDLFGAQVIEALTKTGIDVVVGHRFPQRFNCVAGPGHDLATGARLVNATAALQYAPDHF